MSSESPAPPQLSESERQLLLEQALERQEMLAESGLEMARMFVERGKPEIARRRLEKLIAEYPAATVIPEAERLLCGAWRGTEMDRVELVVHPQVKAHS